VKTIIFLTIIFFAARQKDHARSSVSELLLALKDPRSLSESRNNTLKRKSQEESGDVLSGDEVPGKRSSESGSRRNSRSGTRNSLQKISEVPEGGNKTRKSGLRSFMGYDNKPHDIIIAFALFQSFLAESLLSLHLFSHLSRVSIIFAFVLTFNSFVQSYWYGSWKCGEEHSKTKGRYGTR